MCRIRIKGPLSIHNTVLLPLNIKGMLALVRPLTAFARTFCILEVLQRAASSNAIPMKFIVCEWNALA